MFSQAPSPSDTETTDKMVFPFEFYDPHLDARQEIEREILRSEDPEEIQKLRVQRNSLLPISSLPPEVLTRIFFLCRTHKYGPWIQMDALLPIIWVCHEWRGVALSCPSLWSHIEESNLSWASQSITMSKQADLVAEFNVFDRKKGLDVLGLILAQIHRVRRMNFTFSMNYTFGDSWMQPAPLLEEIYFTYAELPAQLFSGIAPSLRKLTLNECTFTSTPNTFPLSHLRNLSICGTKSPIPLNVMLQTLQTIPDLEVLFLYQVLTASETSHPPIPTVYLPKLQQLRVKLSISLALEFLRYFSTPPFAMVWVVTNADGDEHIFRNLLRVGSGTERNGLIGLEIHQDQPSGYSCIKVSVVPDPSGSGVTNFAMEHLLSWPDVCNLLLNLPIIDLPILTIDSKEPLSLTTWTSVSNACPRIRELHLPSRFSVKSFIDFIISSTPNGDPGNSPPIPFNLSDAFLPDLRLLTLWSPLLADELPTEDTAREFFNALKIRRDQGIGLTRLEMESDIFRVVDLNEVIDEVVICGSLNRMLSPFS